MGKVATLFRTTDSLVRIMCLSGIRLTCAFEENTYPIFDQLQLVSNPKVLDSLYYKYNMVTRRKISVA